MRYRLGEFRPTPDLVGLVLRAHGGVQGREGSPVRVFLAHVIRILAQADHSPEGALDELLQSGLPAGGSLPGGAPRRLLIDLARERERLRDLPDLLTCDALEGEDRAWVSDVHDALAESRDLRAGLRLLECARVDGPDGYVALAASNADVHGEVRRGDTIYAGFAALRAPAGQLTIRPRIHRVVCTNGQVVYDATGEDALEREGSVSAAIAHCLSGAVVEKAARRLRSAVRVPSDEPTQLLPELEDEETREHIRAEWESSADRSLFAAINAVTAVARAEEHFGRRLALESAAGRLLERASALARRPRAPLVDASEEAPRARVSRP